MILSAGKENEWEVKERGVGGYDVAGGEGIFAGNCVKIVVLEEV